MESTMLIPDRDTRSILSNPRTIGGIITLVSAAIVGVGLVMSGHPAQVIPDAKAQRLQKLAAENFVPYDFAEAQITPEEIWGDLSPPFPTGAYWLNLALEDGSTPAVPIPYAVKTTPRGLVASYPNARRMVSTAGVSDLMEPEILFASKEPYMSHAITGFDHFGVTVDFDTAGEGGYTAHIVKASPYVTVEYKDVFPKVTTDMNGFSIFNGETPKGSFTGTEFTLELGTGDKWALFASEPITLEVDKWQISATAPFTGVLRAARILDDTTMDVLSKYAGAYPTGGDFAYEIEGDQATFTYTWKKEGEGDLLMLTLPHHDVVEDEAVVKEAMYKCMKGVMDAIVGDSFSVTEDLPTIGFYAPTKITDEDKVEELLKNLKKDVLGVPPRAADPYNFGKQLARMGRIALMAEEYGDDETKDEAIKIMEKAVTPWLTGENEDALMYESAWGGVVSSNSIADWQQDFGNGRYNDHHFHYGYFIYSLAVISKIDPQFAHDYYEHMHFLTKDIANMDGDSMIFPVARHKDFYDYHSWANGLFKSWDGKTQESSSEAVNAYYGVYLLGKALEDQELEDFGRVLLHTEIKGAQFYWQMKDDSIYGPEFASQRMVGQVGSLDALYTTWFGTEAEYVHGINMMPFTPITEVLLPADFVEKEMPVLAPRIEADDTQIQWKGLMHLTQAILDPEAAYEGFMGTTKTIDDGLSVSDALYWIYTRPANKE
eukprot:CAMPEP_0113947502 /NCGR_PEP_ID=MMETSP1339-20121228/65171_1 /TAXON_ID=94617 /ORGANISM="Fibrocapsa japonica" /LENGTH=714 /DNA_ID=CAMNT_0000954143 /DNA_START=70 /DNA_END=2214 /DNA_ORIENTATION=- /assembly_acc=CAM_ASM_000762